MIKLNNIELLFGKFPNGETNLSKKFIIGEVNLDFYGDVYYIDLKYENDLDLINLMYVKKYLDFLNKGYSTTLNVEYMPYSRMDRENDSYVFLLKYVTDFINNLKFDKVILNDVHSDVTPALIDKCDIVDFVKDSLVGTCTKINFNKQNDFIFFPDAGAQKRYADLCGFNTCVAFKDRDFVTGRIKKLEILGFEPTVAKPKILILDDLCSKGGTFMLSAKKLKELGAGDIHMLVGHCEQTIFDGDILKTDLIESVFTTDSMVRESHPKIKLLWR